MTSEEIRRELDARRAEREQAQAERDTRARHVHSARRSQQIEGGDISAYAQQLSQRYIDGTLGTEEMRELLLEHHGVTVK